MLTGENGILTKAIEAKEANRKAYYLDEVNLIISEKQIEKETNINEKRELIVLVADEIKKKEWQEETTICNDNENDEIEPKDGTKIITETKDGYEIIVKIDNEKNEGEVESITKGTRKAKKVTFYKNVDGKEEIIETMERRFSVKMPDGSNLTNAGYKFVGWSLDKNTKENDNEKLYQARKYI